MRGISALRFAGSGSLPSSATSCAHWSSFQPELCDGVGRQPGEVLHSVPGLTCALLSHEKYNPVYLTLLTVSIQAAASMTLMFSLTPSFARSAWYTCSMLSTRF